MGVGISRCDLCMAKDRKLRTTALTPREKAVLDAYNNRANWRPPSARTLMTIVGIPNVSSTHKTIKQIRRKGYFIDLVIH